MIKRILSVSCAVTLAMTSFQIWALCDLHAGFGFGPMSQNHSYSPNPRIQMPVSAARIEMSHPYAKSVKIGDEADFNVGYHLPAGAADATMRISASNNVSLGGDESHQLSDKKGTVNVPFMVHEQGVHEITLVIEARQGIEPISLVRLIRIRTKS